MFYNIFSSFAYTFSNTRAIMLTISKTNRKNKCYPKMCKMEYEKCAMKKQNRTL